MPRRLVGTVGIIVIALALMAQVQNPVIFSGQKTSGMTSGALIKDTSGAVASYAGTSCTNQFTRSISAAGAATCATVDTTDVTSSIVTLTGSQALSNKTGNISQWTNDTAYGYPMQFMAVSGSAHNPADATTYYFSNYAANPVVGDGTLYLVAPMACTITKAWTHMIIQGTLASSENVTVFIRNFTTTTSTNLSTTSQWTAAAVLVSNTGLSLSVSAGDKIEMGYTSPTWATNPTVVTYDGFAWCKM